MEQVNYYRLNKNELSFVSFIEAPVDSELYGRLSRPIVLVHDTSSSTSFVVYTWTLSWFKRKVELNSPLLLNRYIEIRSLY